RTPPRTSSASPSPSTAPCRKSAERAMQPRPGHVRALQIGFLVLLATCFAQATYWIVAQVLYTASMRDRLSAHHLADAEAARWMLSSGAQADEVRALFPHLVLADGPGGV